MVNQPSLHLGYRFPVLDNVQKVVTEILCEIRGYQWTSQGWIVIK